MASWYSSPRASRLPGTGPGAGSENAAGFCCGIIKVVLPMTLNQALVLIKTNVIRTKEGIGQRRPVFLVCGFQPLHLATFLRACQAERQAQDQAEVLTGRYGDIIGNLARAADSEAISAAVVIEWSDVDPRLGLRASAGWGRVS